MCSLVACTVVRLFSVLFVQHPRLHTLTSLLVFLQYTCYMHRWPEPIGMGNKHVPLKKEELAINARFNNVILYSGAIWRKLNNNNQLCNITASYVYTAQM